MNKFVISLVIIIFSVVSRIIYFAVNSKRLLVYRIVSGIGYSIMIASCLLYSTIFLDISFGISAIVFDLLVISISIASIRNTYSKRILI